MTPQTKRTFTAIATGIASSLSGLLVFLLGSLAVGSGIYGIRGILLAMFIGGLTGTAIRKHSSLPSSTIAGAVGAMIATYAALAMGEVFEPGTLEWAIKGGAYGASAGGVVGGLLGIFGLLKK